MEPADEKRLRQLEIDVATLQTRVGLIQTAVVSGIGLVLAGVLSAVLAMVLTR